MSHSRRVADLEEWEQGMFYLLVFPALVAWVVFLAFVEREDLRDEIDWLLGWCLEGSEAWGDSGHIGGYY